MFSSVIRAARPVVARGFATSARSNKDLVQELYIKELKAYKPTGKAGEHLGSVKSFSSPVAPVAPVSLDSAALASELAAYDADVPSVDAPASATGSAEESDALGASEYIQLLETEATHQPTAAH
ncbi:F-type H+-transporting ATPase subunit h, partial [Phenoliferia sp. Uapishka_3]